MITLAIVLAVLVVVAIVAGVLLTRRKDVVDEVERFHRARTMTTEWSHTAWQGPPLTPDDAAAAKADDGGEQRRRH